MPGQRAAGCQQRKKNGAWWYVAETGGNEVCAFCNDEWKKGGGFRIPPGFIDDFDGNGYEENPKGKGKGQAASSVVVPDLKGNGKGKHSFYKVVPPPPHPPWVPEIARLEARIQGVEDRLQHVEDRVVEMEDGLQILNGKVHNMNDGVDEGIQILHEQGQNMSEGVEARIDGVEDRLQRSEDLSEQLMALTRLG